MALGTVIGLVITFVGVVTIFKGIRIVPQQSVWIVEKLGKFDRALEPGLNFLIPYIETVAYKHSLKEYAMDVQEQTAITRDNVTLVIDGLIYLKIMDPVHASYGVSNPVFAVTQLAQTTMRSEIGKLTMESAFEERDRLNTNIVTAINQAAQSWGIQCMRYEIRNITPPASVLKAMEMQVSADRQKRAVILESEGKRQSQINVSEGEKQQVVLRSEAAQIDQINRARGEAEALLMVAEATAGSIKKIASAINEQGGREAIELKVAEQFIEAFKNLAKTNNTILLPSNIGDAGSMVAQALGVFDTIRNNRVQG
ncbi:MAG TPA: stomatin-like protein [Rickettsiales bacterium]|nr:stomatin-like protein [Rickettsiales bacterium]